MDTLYQQSQPYERPLTIVSKPTFASPLLDFNVGTSGVDEVEEGEVGAHRRDDTPDDWGTLW